MRLTFTSKGDFQMLKLLAWNCEAAGCGPFRQSGTRLPAPCGSRKFFKGIFLICVLASRALAQSTTGSIGGTVTDRAER